MPRQPTTTRKKGRGPSIGDLQKTNPSERPFISLDGLNRWKPSRKPIVGTIGCLWKRHLVGPYPSWTKVPADGKEKYWSVFKETYNWVPEQEDKIHDAFKREIQVSMTRAFSVLSKNLRNGGERPDWLSEEHSKGLMDYWDSEVFNKRRRASVSNRKMLLTTHRYGSSDPESHHIETYNWDPEQEDKIHDAFKREIQVSMTRAFSVLSKNLRNGGEKPDWLSEEHSKGLMEYWDTKAFKRRSDASASNRSKGEKITHRFGSSDRDVNETYNWEPEQEQGDKIYTSLEEYIQVNWASIISTDIYIKIRERMPLYLEDEKWVDDYLLNPSSDIYDSHLMTRDSFLTLRPGMWLHGDVLNSVAYVTWHERSSSIDSRHWNLPTHFCTFAQRDDLNILDLERKVFGRPGFYIGPPDECLSVSIPIHDLNHWLLCRIDFEKMEIAICDTLRDHSADARRKQLIRNAVEKLDQMSRAWKHGEFKVPIVTLPYSYSTTLPQQPNTYDCGLYVCLLMMFRAGLNRALSEEEAASTRRRIAHKLYYANLKLYEKPTGSNRLSQGETSSGVLPQHYQSETHVQTDIPTSFPEPDQRDIPTPFPGPEIDALDLGTQETVERDENVTINRTEETITPGSTREAAKLATEQPMVNCSDQYSDKVDKMSENGSGGTHQSPKGSIAECMSILYTTDGVEVRGKVWLYATTTLFLNSDYRELFSALKPHDRKVWLESMLEIDMQKRGMSTLTSAEAASRGISGNNEFASA